MEEARSNQNICSPRIRSRHFPRQNQEPTSMDSRSSREAKQTAVEKQEQLWSSREAVDISTINDSQSLAYSDTNDYPAATENSFQSMTDNSFLMPTEMENTSTNYANPMWYSFGAGESYAYNGDLSPYPMWYSFGGGESYAYNEDLCPNPMWYSFGGESYVYNGNLSHNPMWYSFGAGESYAYNGDLFRIPMWYSSGADQFHPHNGNLSLTLPETGHPYSVNNIPLYSPGQSSTITDFLKATSTPLQSITTDARNLTIQETHDPLLQHEVVTDSNQSLSPYSRLQTGPEARHQTQPASIKGNRFYPPTYNSAMTSPMLNNLNYGIFITRTHHFYPSERKFLWHNEIDILQCHTYTHEGRNILASLHTTFFRGQKVFFLTVLDIGYTGKERRFKYEATITGDYKFQSYIGNCHTLNDSLMDIVIKDNCLSFYLKNAHDFETVRTAEDDIAAKGFHISIDLMSC